MFGPAIHSLPINVSYTIQVFFMTIFCKCPVCGASSTVNPEMVNKKHRFFKCENNHDFMINIEKQAKSTSQDLWDHMPEWARMLNEIGKTDK